MLFKPEHIDPILSGSKTQTRRIWKKCRARVGAVHKAKTMLFSPDHFALIKITAIKRERLGDISQEDVKREGYGTQEAFKEEWIRINGSWDQETEVFAITFELVQGANGARKAEPSKKAEAARELITRWSVNG